MTSDSEPAFTADGIYAQLRDRICLLDLPPGAPLREQALAEEFGVSRTPIREALTLLRIDGLVVRQPGGGTSVSGIDFKSIRDVYSLRMKLSEIVGDFLLDPVPSHVVERVRHLAATVEEVAATGQPRRLGRLYNDLHEAILDAIGNEPLRDMSDHLFRRTSRLWIQLLPEMDWQEEVQVVREEIGQIIEALESGRPRQLAEIRSKHMSLLLDRFNAYLRKPLL